jgi:hypothetical protein
MYKFCLLTMTSPVCDSELDLAGSGAGGSAASNESWLAGGNPKTACNPVDCDLPYGPQLPRPLVDLSSGKNWAFELVNLPPDVEPGVCLGDRRHRAGSPTSP